MSTPRSQSIRGERGYHRVWVSHPSGRRIEISTFRGQPIDIQEYSTADPFGDATASLGFPQITPYDTPGAGDLWWLVPWALVDIEWWTWDDDLASFTRYPGWSWNGFLVSEELGEDYAWSLKGRLYEADNFKAAPFYPSYPVPYESLIARAFDPSLRTMRVSPLRVIWPEGWNTKVPAFSDPDYLWMLKPFGVKKGDKWTGITTRDTGGWDDLLTGHVQTLLGSMFTPDGDQWTLMKEGVNTPVLKVRESLRAPTPGTLEVWNNVPGVKFNGSRDFTQSANVIYGQGTDLSGSEFSGAQISPDGENTTYEPFSARPAVHPDRGNPRAVPGLVRMEAKISFTAGIDEQAARDIAATQIRRFADPGYVGTLSLETDPLKEGTPFPRCLIQAGQQIVVHDIRGRSVLFHITSCQVNGTSVNLSIDSKFRDALTSKEVWARTRDSLDPVKLLKVGQQSVTVNDLIKPWSSELGSGIIPSGPTLNAKPLFDQMPQTATFPWVDWTTKYPPSRFPQYYVKVSRKNTKAWGYWQDNGWKGNATRPRSTAVPIMLSATGSARLTQIAAYDRNGNQIPVKFHVSLYGNTVTSDSMPKISAEVPTSGRDGYGIGQPYPFFPNAFEDYLPTGEEVPNDYFRPSSGAELIVGWGTRDDPAGHSPGLKSAGAAKTGKLVDESAWSWNLSHDINPRSTADTAKSKTAGLAYVMIYCDDLPASGEVFFLGRCYRTQYGS